MHWRAVSFMKIIVGFGRIQGVRSHQRGFGVGGGIRTRHAEVRFTDGLDRSDQSAKESGSLRPSPFIPAFNLLAQHDLTKSEIG